MAKLLGSQYCIESLRGDVSDLHAVVVDVLSRVGPSTSFRSWKYPDKLSSDVDIAELLKIYDYSEDEEERQVAHIVLMEIVIDRFVLLLQAMGKYTESAGVKISGLSVSTFSSSTSIGPIAKRYWSRMMQLCTGIKEVQLENKQKTKKISELESASTQRSRRSSVESGEHSSDSVSLLSFNVAPSPSPSPSLSHAMTGQISQASVRQPLPPPGRDEYNKATQTIETAFVPCASCDAVQSSLRAAGDALSSMCQSLNVTSALEKYRARINGLAWLSANDVSRWTIEQSKDMASVAAHLKLVASTIEPLKADLESERQKSKDLTSRASASTKEAVRERETSATMRRQYENKLKDMDKTRSAAVVEIEKLNSQFAITKSEFERQISQLKSELTMCKSQLKDLEASKLELIREMEERAANSEHVRSLQTNVDLLNNELADVSSKLHEAAVELNKEKARNKSASQHSVSVQSKQESLLQRLDELDLENSELRLQVADLEEAKEQLQEELAGLAAERDRLVNSAKEKQASSRSETVLSSEKTRLDAEIETLRETVLRLENQLTEAKENERLLVEYPDLHYNGNNAGLSGTGNVAEDMQNQIKANSLRINVLETENGKLRTTVGKMLKSTAGSGGPVATDRLAAAMKGKTTPVQLWKLDSSDRPSDSAASDSRRLQQQQQQQHPDDVNYGDVYLQFQSSSRPEVPRGRPPLVTGQQRTGAPSRSTAYKARRTPETTTGGTRTTATRQPVTPPTGEDSYYRPYDTYTCPRCDKIYKSERDLAVHRSYCFGGV